jgi:hypothetical protein
MGVFLGLHQIINRSAAPASGYAEVFFSTPSFLLATQVVFVLSWSLTAVHNCTVSMIHLCVSFTLLNSFPVPAPFLASLHLLFP